MFNLPRVVGKTKEGEEITADIGRFGPYVKVGKPVCQYQRPGSADH